jgi:hypothetical protein
MKTILILFVIVLAFVSCKEDLTKQSDANSLQEVTNNVTENILYSSPTVYSNIIFHSDAPMVGYSTVKQNPLAKAEMQVVNEACSSMSDSTKVLSKVSSKISFSVNGLNLTKLQTSTPDGVQRVKIAAPVLYGQKINFTISKTTLSNNVKGIQRSAPVNTDTTVTMYVPNLVEITSPKIESNQDLFPYCYYHNFILSWNKDDQNSNGLVVVVEWTGVLLDGNKTAQYVRNIDVIPNDSGSTMLNDKLFDNIPENAIAYITLLRGNVSLIENYLDSQGTTESCRVVAESHAVLPIVLVRTVK